jgi:hypothetical protein
VPRDFLGDTLTDANAQYDMNNAGGIASSDQLFPRDFLGDNATPCP